MSWVVVQAVGWRACGGGYTICGGRLRPGRNITQESCKAKFRRGKSAPTFFSHQGRQVRLAAHGDDFTFVGTWEGLEWIRGRMAEWYDVKDTGIMGSAAAEIGEIAILSRLLRWKENGGSSQAQRCSGAGVRIR